VLALASAQRALYLLFCMLGTWLHLACGLSRTATNSALKVIEMLILMAIRLGYMLANPSTVIFPLASLPSSLPIKLPHDIRTAISSLSLNPIILRSVCCPKCLTKYNLDNLPRVCPRRETSRSKVCGEILCTTRSSRRGPQMVPRTLYSTQDLTSWLEFFLSRPGIEDLIDQSYIHQPSVGVMHSIWDSPAWRSLGSFTTTPGNLTFSYYIDWFNPFSNKIAGKSASCGAIMLFCLNLPYELQHLPENTFFAGITPPPKEPTMITITAVSDPIVDHLEAMWPGRKIRTYRHPEGVSRCLAVLPGIGDLLAIRKAFGFAGVSAHNFCSFCTLRIADIDRLDYESWTARVGVDVRANAEEWRRATTKKRRKEIFDEHGVRWSSLHRLIYRDPVRHTVLGLMHNWIEGILQHHARCKWGIGIVPSLKANQDGDDNDDPVEHNRPHLAEDHDDDVDMLDDELLDLHAESQAFEDIPLHPKRARSMTASMHSDSASEQDISEDANSDDDDDVFQISKSDSESDDSHSDNDSDKQEWRATCTFNAAELSQIHACLSNTVIPSWIERPPKNLGEKSHGKLKADQWLTLFSVFLPLVLPEIWLSSPSKLHMDLLDNFHDLITCTKLVCSHSTSPEAADQYLHHYIQYRKSSKSIFPDVSTRPNHHYAMHNADLMKFWGPLIKLSEFSYERHNGLLQKIKTNGHLCMFIIFSSTL
jgi:hypothetical protein